VGTGLHFRDNGRVIITLKTLSERRDELLEIARRRGAKAVWVFGSVARGDNNPSSDVDFLVEFESGRSLLDQVHLIDELGAVLGTRVDVIARGGLLDRDQHIITEAIPL
jgi:Predicted nucleotidyltransferases